jgi:pyruvate,orthophosphate dikinase
MEEKFVSKALEANLAETRYKDIKIPPEYQSFIDLSKKYYGINKRANDCIIEFQHPFSNKKFVAEELRSILLTDFWFYIGLENADEALQIPVQLMRKLLLGCDSPKLKVMIIRTLLEFIHTLSKDKKPHIELIEICLQTLVDGFKSDPRSFIMASKYIKRYLKLKADHPDLKEKILAYTKAVYIENIKFWQKSSDIEQWIEQEKDILKSETAILRKQIGNKWFYSLSEQTESIKDWNELVEKIPDYDQVAECFANAVETLKTFIEQFHFIFYLLQLDGMETHQERLIWKLNKMLRQTIDELDKEQIRPFINTIFEFADALRAQHGSSILDMFLTVGKKVIELNKEGKIDLVSYYENKLIDFGFETPGMVYVNEDWQLSVNQNHIKNIRVWLELIEYSESEMEKLLSALIVNLRIGGIFISDTDLFQREITKILNSNIAPFYKKVKQLTRIFPVYFNEIGAEGEIRKVTTTIDEISHREDKLVHFLRKQVHTESNNTLIGLTLKVFKFWYDGNLDNLKPVLPQNVFNAIDKESVWFAPIHQMVKKLCELNDSSPEELLTVNEASFEKLIEKLPKGNLKDKERLRDIHLLYAFLKEKYSFETVDITDLLTRFPFISESEIKKLKKALKEDDFETSLKLIYSFMNKLKSIIVDPTPSQSWENIYHKRHIAIGIPSMYGVYRETKFEALGLTFRLENVATRLMEKVVEGINLNYISAKTLSDIYFILDYFREGLELDGITNQSFDANLRMLKYSLSSQSFSFDQYVNIFQFIAEDVKRTLIKYFLKTYEIPLRTIIPQLFNGTKKYSEKEIVQLVNKESEKFYRDVIAEAFLMQPLDNFISRILESLRKMTDNLPAETINEVMSYNSNLIITRLQKPNPLVDNQVFLGSKAYHLKNLRIAGFPIPPGFVLTTEIFRRRKAILGHPELKKEMHDLIKKHLNFVEKGSRKQFGNPQNPLLLSVRSGSAISMPGAMDTFLNVGMNDEITESLSKIPGYAWAAWDSYRRLLQSWGMAYGLSRDVFDEVMDRSKIEFKAVQKADLSPESMKKIAFAYKKTLQKNNIYFEEDLFKQLITTINLVFDSWSSERAKAYREHLEIADEWGTAVIVQRMVFGNIQRNSGTGVVFTQNPKKKKHGVNLYGDFTLQSQGEDIVAGLVKPLPVSNSQRSNNNEKEKTLQDILPQIYQRIYQMSTELIEEYGYSPQEIEFTFESENPDDLYILQTRDLDMAASQPVEIFSVPIEQMMLAGRGLGIGGSAMNGRVAFDLKDIARLRKKYPDDMVILVRPDTVPDDISMIFETDGLLTGKGGATSHAAVTAVRLGITSVVNCTSLEVYEEKKICQLNNFTFQAGDEIAIDGNLGNVYKGHYPIESEQNYTDFRY